MGANEMEATTTSKPPRISTLLGNNSSLPDACDIGSGTVDTFSNKRASQNITTPVEGNRQCGATFRLIKVCVECVTSLVIKVNSDDVTMMTLW